MTNDSVEVVEETKDRAVTKKDMLLVIGAVFCGCIVDILHGALIKNLEETNKRTAYRITALERKVFTEPYITQYESDLKKEDNVVDVVPVVIDDSGDTTTE